MPAGSFDDRFVFPYIVHTLPLYIALSTIHLFFY